MNVSKELAVMMALTDLLEGINPTKLNPALGENFDLDLRKKVFRGKLTIGTEVQMPAAAILESPAPSDSQHSGEEGAKKNESWRILLQGFATDDKLNPLDPAYMLKAAMQVQLSKVIAVHDQTGKPVFPNEYMLGNLISGLKISQGVVRPPQESVSQYAFCYIPLTVSLQTDVTNPYVALT